MAYFIHVALQFFTYAFPLNYFYSTILDIVINYDNIIAMKKTCKMNWKISFYNETVMKQIRSFPIGIQTNLTYILELIAELGPNLGKPHTATLGKGLFEIRAKGKEGISRSFFCAIHEKEVVILHSIIKKSRKAPKKDLTLATRRMKEIKNE